MEITNQVITYKQIREGYVIDRDEAGIAAYDVTPERKNTFLANPFLKDDSKCMIYLSRVDGIVRGVVTFFPTLTKAGDEYLETVGASAMQVQEEFQEMALGAELVTYPFYNENNKMLVYAGFSADALPIYKAMKFGVFEMPKMMQPISTRLIFERAGLKGLLLDLSTMVSNCVVRPYIAIAKLGSRCLSKKFQVKRIDKIPDWVDDMVLNDGHKYTEVHNKEWFQWNIDYCFLENPRNKQEFFAIYQNEKPIGFYMIKDRLRTLGGLKEHTMVFRSIVEWGSYDETKLSEYDIYRLALTNRPKDVKMIQVASFDKEVTRKMKRLGFLHHGFAYMGCRDLTKQYKDSKNPDLWRIRVGYNDVNFGI